MRISLGLKPLSTGPKVEKVVDADKKSREDAKHARTAELEEAIQRYQCKPHMLGVAAMYQRCIW